MSALSILLDSLIDYAGLFPPAKLSMADAVRNYAAYRRGAEATFLGRFVVPVARLGEFETEYAKLATAEQAAWQLTVIAGADATADARATQSFNLRQSYARIISIEAKATTPAEVSQLATSFPSGIEIWIETPTTGDVASLIASVHQAGAGAKIRTGGITPDAFPPAKDVVRFMRACRQANVAFKATAGLHHPLRGDYALTYEPNSPRATMFGFLNIFLAATLVAEGGTDAEASALLDERDPGKFSVTPDAIASQDHRFTTAQLASLRKNFCRSFGSCSFTEPIDGLRQFSWL